MTRRQFLLRRVFSIPGLVEFLPGNSMNDTGSYLAASTIRRWKTLGYIDLRGERYVLTRAGYHAA